MAMRLMTRKHKKLRPYSKLDLDKAEKFLNDNNLRKPTLNILLCFAFYPLLLLITITPSAKPFLNYLNTGNDYINLFILIIPLAIGSKLAENHELKLVLDYFKKMKIEPEIKKKHRNQ